MKKNNLFKAIGIVILLYICLSWLIPIIYGITGTKGDVSHQIGFVSIVSVLANTFSGFGNVIFYVLLVGGFYGVLKATGAYDKMMSKLVEKKKTIFLFNMILVALLTATLIAAILKLSTGLSLLFLILISILVFAIVVALAIVLKAVVKDENKLVLVSIIVLMTLTASIAGLDLSLLILYPLIFGYVAKLGYDKITGVAASVGATIVGLYGSVFANTLYGINTQVLTTTKFSTGIAAKVILLVVGLVLLLTLTLMYVKSHKANKTLDNSKNHKNEKYNKNDIKVKGIGALPAFIIVGLLYVVLFLGTTAWAQMFGVSQSIFEKAHTSWTGFTIGGFPVLNKLFGGIGAFGTWFDPNRYSTYSMLLLLAMVVITLFYGKSVKKSFEGFVEGLKSFIVPATIAVLVSSVFVFVYYNPFLNPVTELLLKATDGFNVTLASLYTLINSFFYVDYYYLAAMTMQSIAQKYTDASVQSVLSLMYVSIYSVVMLVAPTSMILMLGLSISETKYTDWIKFIWILAIALLLVAFVVLMTMANVIPMWAGIVVGIVVVIILMAIYAVINHLI